MFACITIICLMTLGCGTIIHGTRQKIMFESSPAQASVQVTDAKGTDHGGCVTPCEINLKRDGRYQVKVIKKGYPKKEFFLEGRVSGWLLGSLFWGGPIGIIVDFANGGAYNLSPSEINITFEADTLTHISDDIDDEESGIFDYGI